MRNGQTCSDYLFLSGHAGQLSPLVTFYVDRIFYCFNFGVRSE